MIQGSSCPPQILRPVTAPRTFTVTFHPWEGEQNRSFEERQTKVRSAKTASVLARKVLRKSDLLCDAILLCCFLCPKRRHFPRSWSEPSFTKQIEFNNQRKTDVKLKMKPGNVSSYLLSKTLDVSPYLLHLSDVLLSSLNNRSGSSPNGFSEPVRNRFRKTTSCDFACHGTRLGM